MEQANARTKIIGISPDQTAAVSSEFDDGHAALLKHC
jgi:hypothetical protein